MTIQEAIASKLTTGLEPEHLEVSNESSRHNVPPGAESHFRLLVVSPCFSGQSRVERHRAINHLLAAELAGPVHALAIDAFTPAEWEARAMKAGTSPACRGGSKA